MNEENARMRARMTKLIADQNQKRVYADGLIGSIRQLINPTLKHIEEMDVSEAALLMDQLVMTQAELLVIGSDIARLRQALGEA